MALNPQRIGANHGTRSLKTPSIRLSDERPSTTTAYAEIITGSGAPSGGYGRDSSATMLYMRQDASGVGTALYVTANGGTAWTACDPAVLSSLDLDGNELVLDADGDTSITADTDDQIDVRISGADDFVFTANTFTAASGSSIATNTIVETTSGSGVTVDGLLIKDGDVHLVDSDVLYLGTGDDIGMSWDGTSLKVTQAATNSAIQLGVDGAGIDLLLLGDTASAACTWDQSADSLVFSGVAKLKLQTIADPGTGVAIPVTNSGSVAITTAAAETNTLADPAYMGQTLSLFCDTYAVGDRVVTAASRINQTGNTIMTFGAAGDYIKLEAITIGGALKWQVVANDGVALS